MNLSTNQKVLSQFFYCAEQPRLTSPFPKLEKSFYITGGLGPDGDMDSGLDGMHAFLKANYPWLTREARTDLNYQFIMNWK